jgi:hypothetical protein
MIKGREEIFVPSLRRGATWTSWKRLWIVQQGDRPTTLPPATHSRPHNLELIAPARLDGLRKKASSANEAIMQQTAPRRVRLGRPDTAWRRAALEVAGSLLQGQVDARRLMPFVRALAVAMVSTAGMSQATAPSARMSGL